MANASITLPSVEGMSQNEVLNGKSIDLVIRQVAIHELPAMSAAVVKDPKGHRFEPSTNPQLYIEADSGRWTAWVDRGVLGGSAVIDRDGLQWQSPKPAGDARSRAEVIEDANVVPPGLVRAISRWIDQMAVERRPSGVERLFKLSEELVLHLRSALEERDELRRRLTDALGSQQHADERIRVLEAQVTALEAQLLEVNAAVAGENATFVGQSRTSLAAMAMTALALLAALASPFVSDALSNDDTAAIVEAQRQTTAALEAAAAPSPVDLSIEAALRCVVDEDQQ